MPELVCAPAGFNQLSGTIPDVFRAGSPLRVLSALAAGLSGPIPPSLGTVKELEVLDLGYNFLNGTIPANMGYSRYLRYCYLMGNSLTGSFSPPPPPPPTHTHTPHSAVMTKSRSCCSCEIVGAVECVLGSEDMQRAKVA